METASGRESGKGRSHRALARDPLAGMTKLQAFAAAKEAGLVDGLPQDRWASVFNAFFDGYVVNVMKALASPQLARHPEAWAKLASLLVDDYKKATPIDRILASGEILQKLRDGPIDRASQLLGQQPLPSKSSSNTETGPVDDAEQSTVPTRAAEVEPGEQKLSRDSKRRLADCNHLSTSQERFGSPTSTVSGRATTAAWKRWNKA